MHKAVDNLRVCKDGKVLHIMDFLVTLSQEMAIILLQILLMATDPMIPLLRSLTIRIWIGESSGQLFLQGSR